MDSNGEIKALRVGIDTGGTFTDIIGIKNGELYTEKLPSTPQKPDLAFKKALSLIKDNNIDLDFLCHGTTVAVNAILQQQKQPVLLLTTKGFTDVIEIGDQRRPELYNLIEQPKKVLLSESQRIGIEGRINHKGVVLKPLDYNIESLGSRIIEDRIQSIAVCLLNSFINHNHEKQLCSELKKYFGKYKYPINISRSSDIAPIIREYDRTVTTVMNAIVTPILKDYFFNLEDHLSELNFTCPLRLMKSNAGIGTVHELCNYGVQTLLGGLAGGVMAGEYVSEQLDTPNIITLDIGGTSCDVATLENKSATIRDYLEISGFKASVPAVEIDTIGAGGGSIAKIVDGLLSVGPDSQGAVPGPACYGNAMIPTMTDANLVLGLLEADNFAGQKNLNLDRAYSAIKTHVAEPLDLSVEEAAQGIRQILNQNMAATIYKLTIGKGKNPKDYALCAFGGAGPVHGVDLAEQLEIPTTIIPAFPGLWSAFGLLTSELRFDKIQSFMLPLHEEHWSSVIKNLDTLEEQLKDHIKQQELSLKGIQIEWRAEIQYEGQGYTLPVLINQNLHNADQAVQDTLVKFEQAHQEYYGWIDQERTLILVNLWVRIKIPSQKISLPKLEKGTSNPNDVAIIKTKAIYYQSAFHSTTVYKKDKLLTNNLIRGPALILQDDTTTFIPPTYQGEIDHFGYILIRSVA